MLEIPGLSCAESKLSHRKGWLTKIGGSNTNRTTKSEELFEQIDLCVRFQ